MVVSEEFIKCCTTSLEGNFGQLSHEIINKILIKKNITNDSKINDLKDFIDLIEKNISVFSGKHKAAEICNIMRAKAIPQSVGMTEEVKTVDMALSPELDKEINTFLTTHSLPNEADISDYTKYLTMKYGGNTRALEKDIVEKVKQRVRDGIMKNILSGEISKFLERYPQPEKSDVDDFIKYMALLKLSLDEDLMRDELEKERLYRKFHEPTATSENSELSEFITFVKSNNDKESVGKLMQTQGLSYLIKDEKGVSDESLTEFMEIVTPSESDMKDALEGLGLKHLIKGKK
ncbi:MAG: hypothetical protein ABIH80_04935 [Methanobacteriota archaeon]